MHSLMDSQSSSSDIYSFSYESYPGSRRNSYSSFQNESISSSTSGDRSSPNLPDLYEYAEKKKWHKVKALLKLPMAKDETTFADTSGLTFLGLCVAFSAPEEVLRQVLDMHPQHVFAQDIYGATALHIACLNGASLQTVFVLINECKDLVKVPDIDGRLPIHHCVECICRDEISLDASINVMRANIDVDPDILTVEDNNGCTVVDLIQDARCIETNTTSENQRLKAVYRFLKTSTIQNWKMKKQMWEQKKTEESEQTTHTTMNSSASYYSMSNISPPDSDVSRFDVSFCNMNEG
jgi:hypothetical protein